MTNYIVNALEKDQGLVRRLPGVAGFWIFILIDMVVFAALFLSYVVERVDQVALFSASQATLDVRLGLFNMLVLLTSSWFVAMAVHLARRGQSREVAWLLWGGVLSGLIFSVVKVYEYTEKFSAGTSMLTNDFYMFYFTLTGIHFVHVLIGVMVLSFLAVRAKRGGYSHGNAKGLEVGATYWHMVDLLWIMLFPLLYMAR